MTSSTDRMTSISLRTKDRRTAMAQSRHIKSALKAIYADNPNATYEELREHLRDIAEGELSTSRSDLFLPDMSDIYRDQYGELGQSLTAAIASESLTIDQHRYILEALEVLKACMKRIEGNSKPLIDYIDRFDAANNQDSKEHQFLSVTSNNAKYATPKGITISTLIEQYEQENIPNWKPATVRENRSSHLVLIEIFKYLGLDDVNEVPRSDMMKVREVLQQLPKNRKQRFKGIPLSDLLSRTDKTDCLDAVTINNKYLIKMAAIFKWAVRNGLIIKNMAEGLEIKTPRHKASNARAAFSTEQVKQLLSAAKAYSRKKSGKPYHYYVTVLAAITGARVNEIAQLQVKDVRSTEAGTTYIHINEDNSSLEGKSIKNAHSERYVPLVDGAYCFILADFVSLVEERRKVEGDDAMLFEGLRLMKNGYGEQVSKWFNRTLLPKVLSDRKGLVFHSFRHTVATQLKRRGIELAYSQAIMGHSSGSITYDRYAKDVEVDRLLHVMTSIYKEES